jgi:hypothetical protein
MPNFFNPSPSITKINQILSNSNYISPTTSNNTSTSISGSASGGEAWSGISSSSLLFLFCCIFNPVIISDIIISLLTGRS